MVNDTSSDAEIIAASLIDPDCFGLLFERHFQAVFSYAVRSIGVTEGQEIASEVFVQAFSSRRRFDLTYRSARPWLLGIASNLVSTRYRSFERRNRAYRRALGRDGDTEEFEQLQNSTPEVSVGASVEWQCWNGERWVGTHQLLRDWTDSGPQAIEVPPEPRRPSPRLVFQYPTRTG